MEGDKAVEKEMVEEHNQGLLSSTQMLSHLQRLMLVLRYIPHCKDFELYDKAVYFLVQHGRKLKCFISETIDFLEITSEVMCC